MNIPQSRYSCLFKQCDSMGSIHLITPKHQHPTDLSKLKWRTTARKLNMKLSNLQFDITAVSPFLSLFSMKEWHLQTLAGRERGQRETKTIRCLSAVFPLCATSKPCGKRIERWDFSPAFWCLAFWPACHFRKAQQGMRLSFLVWGLCGLNGATAAAAMAIFSLKLAKQFQKAY